MSDRRHGATSIERELRSSTRSTGADIEAAAAPEEGAAQSSDGSRSLVTSFVLMVVVGLGNKIFQKLQTVPMHNYANSLNLMTTFFYIPASFAYILPMLKWGNQITPQQRAMPMKVFAVMGLLDSAAGIMVVFASTYLDGTLLILLSQSAIPISMGISKAMLSEKYKPLQYLGALVVSGGIAVVLAPRLGRTTPSSNAGDSSAAGELLVVEGDDTVWLHATSPRAEDTTVDGSKTLLWSIVMILSCVPMTLSSVYKEMVLGKTDLDPIYLNGWIAFWQFLFSIPIAIPAAMVSDPPVEPHMLLRNLFDGLVCYTGHNSITTSYHESHPDFKNFEVDRCGDAPVFVSLYLVFNIGYNILIILILKFGSANILWLAMTIMVPLGSMTFALPFIPGGAPLKWTDVLGLFVILGGLVLYRFGQTHLRRCRGGVTASGELERGLLVQDSAGAE
jgi:drug/metabolite transporter (DMT)-like permease